MNYEHTEIIIKNIIKSLRDEILEILKKENPDRSDYLLINRFLNIVLDLEGLEFDIERLIKGIDPISI